MIAAAKTALLAVLGLALATTGLSVPPVASIAASASPSDFALTISLSASTGWDNGVPLVVTATVVNNSDASQPVVPLGLAWPKALSVPSVSGCSWRTTPWDPQATVSSGYCDLSQPDAGQSTTVTFTFRMPSSGGQVSQITGAVFPPDWIFVYYGSFIPDPPSTLLPVRRTFYVEPLAFSVLNTVTRAGNAVFVDVSGFRDVRVLGLRWSRGDTRVVLFRLPETEEVVVSLPIPRRDPTGWRDLTLVVPDGSLSQFGFKSSTKGAFNLTIPYAVLVEPRGSQGSQFVNR
jgi:hypothetical protein